MKKRMKKLASKKGVTLVELVVGIALISIVFSSTLGAMVGGYTTTLKNADQNKAAVLNSSLNEVMINTLHNMKLSDTSAGDPGRIVEGSGISDSDKQVSYVDSPDGTTQTEVQITALVAAVKAVVPEAEYVPFDQFPKLSKTASDPNDYVPDYQFTIKVNEGDDGAPADPNDGEYHTNALRKSDTSSIKVPGLVLKTCLLSSSGPVMYEAYVPFTK